MWKVYTGKFYCLLSLLFLCHSVLLLVSAGVVFVLIALVKRDFASAVVKFSPVNNSQSQGISRNLRFLLDM